MKFRYVKEKVIMAICGASALFAASMLILILAIFFIKGYASLNLHFLITPDSATAYAFGTGVANAIVGSVLVALFATVLAIPFGIGTAIYLRKYAPENNFTSILRLMIEVLSGTPSIIMGIVALFLLVVYLKPITGGESLIAAGVALAALIIPVIERATEDAIERVPSDLEEASYAVGATKWHTIKEVIVPYASSGIIVGAVLAFGRAAEESAVVFLTAGYSQFFPELMVRANPNFLLGLKIYPFNNLIGTLPVYLYTAYENSNVYPISATFAAGFVLIVIVMLINLSAKSIFYFATSKKQGTIYARLSSMLDGTFGGISGKKQEEPSIEDVPDEITLPPVDQIVSHDTPIKVPIDPEKVAIQKSIDKAIHDLNVIPDTEIDSGTVREYAISVEKLSTDDLDQPKPSGDNLISGKDTNQERELKEHHFSLSNVGIRLSQIFRRLVRLLARADRERNVRKAKPQSREPESNPDFILDMPKIIGVARSFAFTIVPFVFIGLLLIILTGVVPGLSPPGSKSPTGSLNVQIMTIVLCLMGTVTSLFLVRQSTIFLLKRNKGVLGHRIAEFCAIGAGFGLILFTAFIFSTHLFSPAASMIPSVQGSGVPESQMGATTMPGGFTFTVTQLFQGFNLFGGLNTSGSLTVNTTASSSSADRNARLAAFLAAQNNGGEGESAPSPSITSTPAPVLSSPPTPQPTLQQPTTPFVPVKSALDLGESYWYGDNTRPCLATVYNATTLPFYFYYDADWNRFVQVNPVQTGDVFLVVFIRIEDTGNMSAIVPSADEFNIFYQGQSYSHNPYFDTSVISTTELNEYTANFNLMPYQWIREIGQQKRDYAFLTGYNIFGQNQTVISNYSANANNAAPPTAGFDTNGMGYFIMPGRSNAIDGYLIYEIPQSAALDLKDTYEQVAFNSFSSTQWRLGK